MTKKFKPSKKDCNTVQTRLDNITKTEEVQKWLDRKVKKHKEEKK